MRLILQEHLSRTPFHKIEYQNYCKYLKGHSVRKIGNIKKVSYYEQLYTKNALNEVRLLGRFIVKIRTRQQKPMSDVTLTGLLL